MSLSGGKGNSRANTTATNTTTNTATTVNTVDNRAVQGDNANIGGNVTLNAGDIQAPVNVSTTDFGAIQGALDFALESTTAAQKESGAQIATAFAAADKSRQSETAGAINNFLKYGAIVAVVVAVAWVATRKKS
jgi:hypothetical protein